MVEQRDLAEAALAAAAAAARVQALPEALSLPVPHIQQAYNWDCGLACVLMVLRTLGMQHQHMGTLLQLCPTRSIWTIDLAHLLARCGATVQMLTVTLGANQAYSGERFYAETMEADSRRVERLFQTAATTGIAVQQRSLPLAHLRSLLLSGTCLLLALVDKVTLASAGLATHSSGGLGSMWSRGGVRRSGRLASSADGEGGGSGSNANRAADGEDVAAAAADAPEQAATNAAETEGGSSRQPATEHAPAWDGAASGGGGGYLGHYIVVCGYDARSDEFELRDPASDRARLWISAAQLEAARKCFGTDEDLLLVSAAGVSGAGASAGSSAAAAASAGALPASGQQRYQQQQQQQQQQRVEQQPAAEPPCIVYG